MGPGRPAPQGLGRPAMFWAQALRATWLTGPVARCFPRC